MMPAASAAGSPARAGPFPKERNRPMGNRHRLNNALRAGDLAQVRALLDSGTSAHGRDESGRTVLLHAASGSRVHSDPGLMDLLRLLIDRDADLDVQSSRGESAAGQLAQAGRFDGVALLLAAGADESPLHWTPLMKAVAIGTLADVQREAAALQAQGGSLEVRDPFGRTAWLMAVHGGDVDKARWLAEHGADFTAAGDEGAPALFLAVQGHHAPMLRWLLQEGHDVEQTDDHGRTALMQAAEHGHEEGLRLLLHAGARIEREHNGETALARVQSATAARLLLQAGADPARLTHEARRDLLGLPREPDESPLAGVTPKQFTDARTRRFGRRNGERMNPPYWLAMIRAGVDAYRASRHFGHDRAWNDPPGWSAQRYGQSITFLPDGRIVQIAGEHEDGYDPDFCIYNDVFVHHPDGRIDIHGYPEDVFPPTDFHTATLMGDEVIVIGSLGYQGHRVFGSTPVFSLSLADFSMRQLQIAGTPPGWIYEHRARPCGPRQIVASGGTLVVQRDGRELHPPNAQDFVLDLDAQAWRHGPGLQ